MERAFELGIDVPRTLEGWAEFFPRYTRLPWLQGKSHARMQTMREYLRLAFHRVPIGVRHRNSLERLMHAAIMRPARWRLDHDCYAFPFELRLKERMDRFFLPPKPKVDAQRLSTEVVTC